MSKLLGIFKREHSIRGFRRQEAQYSSSFGARESRALVDGREVKDIVLGAYKEIAPPLIWIYCWSTRNACGWSEENCMGRVVYAIASPTGLKTPGYPHMTKKLSIHSSGNRYWLSTEHFSRRSEREVWIVGTGKGEDSYPVNQIILRTILQIQVCMKGD